jgi:hypothetical protein
MFVVLLAMTFQNKDTLRISRNAPENGQRHIKRELLQRGLQNPFLYVSPWGMIVMMLEGTRSTSPEKEVLWNNVEGVYPRFQFSFQVQLKYISL